MGTLDDAIREHLELKRRSGASDDEVKRLESEALGPVPRDPAPASPAADEVAPEALEPELPAEPEAAAAAPEPPARPEAPARDEPWLADDDLEPGPQQSTSEFSAVDAAAATGRKPSDYVAPDEEAEDLLEETPDFLQETPEHDRLWFEQRPPRDFDFDQ
jgi:hypothetical protein